MSKPVVLSIVFIICLSNVFAQNWVQIGGDIEGEAAQDWCCLGVSLSSDGNTLAIGADANSGNGIQSGHVRIYSWKGTDWTQKGLDIDGEASFDKSGESVSISSDGSTIAIGAYGNDGMASDAGHVRVFSWSGTTWTQKGLDIDGDAKLDNFGTSVSMSSNGNTIAIGAIENDGKATDAGYVRVFIWGGSSWTQKGSDIEGITAKDHFGEGVSLSSDGNNLAIGAPNNIGSGTYGGGQVRMFTWSGSAWTQKGLDLDGEANGDGSGWCVSLSSDGNTLAIGADANSGNGIHSGHTRVYVWSGSIWKQKGKDIDGESAGDNSGISISISSDGNTLAIGAPENDGNGDRAGHVRVFSWSGTTWTQKGLDIDGGAGDNFGVRVSLSSDGNFVAISAFGSKDKDYAGYVRVFHYEVLSGITHNTVSSVKIYPNPSTESFTLNLGQNYQSIELKVMNSIGQIVLMKKVKSASEVEFEIMGKKGVYLVGISTNEGLLTTVKVIKE